MPQQNWLSIPFLDVVTQSNWWWVAAGIGYAVLRVAEYIGKRLIEGKPEAEHVDHLMRWADLQKKLDDGKMNLDDLKKLRMQALGKKIEGAAVVAEQYASTANRLLTKAGELFPRSEKSGDRNENSSEWRSDFLRKKISNSMSQQEMNAVSWELFLDANRELSNLMLQIKAEASKEEVKALLTAHEFWLKFREAEASREASVWEGGSIRPLMFNSAMEAITRERIAQLRWRNKNEVSEIIKINRRKTPVNIIEHIIVGVPRERVEQLLGVPYLIVGDCMYYNYEDTQVEVRLRSGVVEAVTIALCHGHKFFGTSSTGLTDIPLGQLTLADLLKADPGLSIQYNFSVRTKEVFVRPRIGPPGAWTEYCFGALVVFSGAGRLQETDFEWNHATESLSTHPRDVLINYMAIPGPGDGPPAFAWFIN